MKTEKLERYREERSKCLAKIDILQARVNVLDQKIMESENLEIRALMKNENMTLADLMAMVREMQEHRHASLHGNVEHDRYFNGDKNTAYPGYANDEEDHEPNDEI